MNKREFFKLLPGFSIIPSIDMSPVLHYRITYKKLEARSDGQRVEIATDDNSFYTVCSKGKDVDEWHSMLNGQPIKLIALKYGWEGDDDIKNYGRISLKTGKEIRDFLNNKLYYIDISYKKLPN